MGKNKRTLSGAVSQHHIWTLPRNSTGRSRGGNGYGKSYATSIFQGF